MLSRQNDKTHWVKCPCGWEGYSADMTHGYISHGNPENCDVEPVDYCPKCGIDEGECKIYNVEGKGLVEITD